MTNRNEVEGNSHLTSNNVPVRNLWHMLSYSWKDLRLLNRWKGDVDKAPSFDALLAKILSNLVSQRLRIGLGRNYRPEEKTLSNLRGRIDFTTSIKKMHFQNAKAHCRYQSFDSNVIKNQIIRSTLNTVSTSGHFGTDKEIASNLRQKLRRIVQRLSHIDLIEVRPAIIKRQQLERDDYDYQLMLTICNLILSRQIPNEQNANHSSQQVDRDWKFVCRLFESFVANFYRYHLTGWAVQSQRSLSWPTKDQSRYLPKMKPDLILLHHDTQTRIILDTKFTPNSLKQGWHNNLTFDSSHLYQLYSYIRSQEHKWGPMRGVLLYPAARHSLSETVQMNEHHVHWQTIDLSLPWQEIEENLLALVENFLAKKQA